MDIQHRIQGADVRGGNQQLGENDDVHMQRVSLAAALQVFHGPLMPGAGIVDAVHPDIRTDSTPAEPS